MKKMRQPGIIPICSIIIAVTLWTAPALLAADHSEHSPGATPKAGKMEGCKAMMQERQKMMSQMKQQDQKLQRLANQLDQGSEKQKVDRLVQLVQEMVETRVAAHEKMETMHSRMMQHMAQHMQKGQMSMAQCPMMQPGEGMGGSAENSEQGAEAHDEHHRAGASDQQ